MTTSECKSAVIVEDSAGHFDWCGQKLQILMASKCVSPIVQLITWSRTCLEELTVSSLCSLPYLQNPATVSVQSQVTKPRPLYFINIHFSGPPPTPMSCTWSRLSKFSYWSLKLRRNFSSLPGMIGLQASLTPPHRACLGHATSLLLSAGVDT
jgi:hypothetical protein